MKKNILKAAFAVAAIAAMTLACSKPNPGDEKITIKGTLPEILGWKWQADDKLTVIGTTTEAFNLSSGAGTGLAEFTGNPVGGNSFTILYPGTCATVAEAEVMDWMHQKQVGNDSPAHLQYVAALKDVDAYNEFAFTADWATAHGGTLKQSGILKLELALPAAIPGVSRIEVADQGEVLTVGLDLENVELAEGNILTAYAGFPWEDLDIPADGQITLTLNASDGGVWTNIITYPEASSLRSGMVNTIQPDAANWTAAEQGDGSEGDPYILRSVDQFKAFGDKLVEGETRYFKLAADIDLSAETTWERPHPDADTKRFVFDGQEHAIKNLTTTFDNGYPSIFGAINGTVKNLNFENCSITYTAATGGGPLGILAGWAGINNASFDATIENVHAKKCTISTQSSKNTTGGLVGRAHNAKFINCSYDGIVERTSTAASGYIYTGGLVGSDEWAADDYITTFKNCHTSGTLTTKSGNSTGGILGGTNAGAHIKMEDCSSTMTISTVGSVTGGLQGYTGFGIFTNCTYEGTINAGNSYVGGISAYTAHWVHISNCHSAGEITATGDRVGGIIGDMNPSADDTEGTEITDCYSTMNISAKSYVGGINGNCATNDNGKRKAIARCYATGNLTGGGSVGGLIGYLRNADVEDCAFYGTVNATGQRIGGFIGNAGHGNLTVRRCYTGSSVKTTQLGAGGFIGQAQAANTVDGTHADIGLTVEKCIAWGTSVVAEAGSINQWGSGAFIGSVAGGSTLTDNFRNPEMTVSYNCANGDWPKVYDQENSNKDNPLVYYDGAKDAPATCQAPYHAKAAAAGKTAAQVATDLGFSATLWDLSGNVPQLKKAE